MPENKQVSKISLKTIGCKPKAVVAKPEGEFLRLAIIMGMASALKIVEDVAEGKKFTAVLGQFEATNLQTNDVFTSGVLYLPGGFQDGLIEAVKRLQSD